MNRRDFLKKSTKAMFIFGAGAWVAKNGIYRPAEARMNLATIGGSSSGGAAPVAIDVGNPATERSTHSSNPAGYTWIAEHNPANATGTITQIDIYVYGAMSNLRVATFFRPDAGGYPNRLSARARTNTTFNIGGTGKSTFTAPTDFTAFEVQTGDYIGFECASGHIYYDTGDALAIWYVAGDKTATADVDYTHATSGAVISLYGTGTT